MSKKQGINILLSRKLSKNQIEKVNLLRKWFAEEKGKSYSVFLAENF